MAPRSRFGAEKEVTMQYGSIGKAPGSLVSKSDRTMANPGKARNYELSESFLFREACLVRDLLAFFLKDPDEKKAVEYWKFFNDQWKNNIINYIKNTAGTQVIHDEEIDHYKNHYKYRTAVRLVQEFVNRKTEMARIMEKYPNAGPTTNRTLFGFKRSLDSIHSRLMPYLKELKASVDDPDATFVNK